jgi:hypothetical protein
MKGKVIIGLALALASSPAYADGIQSARGISQSDWSASSAYKNFQCPEGTARGEGVDMNFTTDRSDDYYYVSCNPIFVSKTALIPTPTLTPPTAPTIFTPKQPESNTEIMFTSKGTQSETPTPTLVATVVTNTTPTVKSSTTEITDSATAVVKTKSILDEELDLDWDWDKILAWIIAWFDSWWLKL